MPVRLACCFVAIGLGMLSGCGGSARFVQVTQDGGVVAIPYNSNSWPSYYRDQAEKMIASRCPGGYEIVREEEVVTGQKSYTSARSDTQEAPTMLIGGGDSKKEKKGRNGERTTETFGGIAVPIGQDRTTTEQTTTYSNVTEWRIYYRPLGGAIVPAGVVEKK